MWRSSTPTRTLREALEGAGNNRLKRWRVLLALSALALFSAFMRVEMARGDANFSGATAEGLLKSDPALVHYVTSRIVEGGGGAPTALRADPLVEHPAGMDLPSALTIGQEYLIAWSHLLFGGERPLHETALLLMALTAACALFGVFGVAREWTGSYSWGLFAALSWTLLPGAYRSVGVLFLREDLAFPLLMAGLWALLRGRRTRRPMDHLLAGALLGLALATWHASAHFALIIAACLLTSVLLGSERPAPAKLGLLVPLAAVITVSLFPVGRARLLFLTPALFVLTAAAVANRPGLDKSRRAMEALGVLLLGAMLSRLFGGGVVEDSHVHELLIAKLLHLGQRPLDPSALTFDARLLWQGPFETSSLTQALLSLSLAALGLAATLKRDLLSHFARALVLLSTAAGWLITRVLILPTALLPAAGAALLARNERGPAMAAALLIAQAGLFYQHVSTQELSWYKPPGRQAELEAMISAVEANVPPGEAVACDFMNSTAILTHTRRPILVQPKYELDASRRAAEGFYLGFFHAEASEFKRSLLEEQRCRYLLVDRFTLGVLKATRYLAGLRPGEEPPAESAAAALLSQDERVLESLPGYELIWRSPGDVLQRNGTPYDLYRLYRLTPE